LNSDGRSSSWHSFIKSMRMLRAAFTSRCHEIAQLSHLTTSWLASNRPFFSLYTSMGWLHIQHAEHTFDVRNSQILTTVARLRISRLIFRMGGFGLPLN